MGGGLAGEARDGHINRVMMTESDSHGARKLDYCYHNVSPVILNCLWAVMGRCLIESFIAQAEVVRSTLFSQGSYITLLLPYA